MGRDHSKWVLTHQPCSECGSSDAVSYNDRGWGHCFSCGRNIKSIDKRSDVLYNQSIDTLKGTPKRSSTDSVRSSFMYNYNSNTTKDNTLIMVTTKEYIPLRGLSNDTLRFYGAVTLVENDSPKAVVFPYTDNTYKQRSLSVKDFSWPNGNKGASLFGMNKFPKGSSKSITITEGEIDAMSVYQMFGSKYPAVSVQSSGSARKNCEAAYDYLNSFETIYLCFDNDDVGQKACTEVATLFDVNKVFHVKMSGDGLKDANDYLMKGKSAEFVRIWWNSKKFIPKGIVNSYSDIEEVLRKGRVGAIADYPFPTLQDMTYGIREGELVLFTAQSKVGKTEIMRAIEYNLIKNTDYNIGIIHLEEEEKRSVQGLLSYELGHPVHLPDSTSSVDEQVAAYQSLTRREGRVNYYTHFGSDDPDTILDAIRYLVSVLHCKFIFLDHITMLVTGYEGDDERKKLDYISTRLAMLTRELGFTLFLVSHVNDNGQTRGSRNITKVADLIVHLDRDTESPDFDRRNTTSLMVKGNRFAGKSGPAGYLLFDPTTYQVKEKSLNAEMGSEISPELARF